MTFLKLYLRINQEIMTVSSYYRGICILLKNIYQYKIIFRLTNNLSYGNMTIVHFYFVLLILIYFYSV